MQLIAWIVTGKITTTHRECLFVPQSLTTSQLSFLLAAIISLIPFAIDAYLPALSIMSAELGTSLHRLEWTITTFFVGYALGSLVGGPISDHLGRRVIAVIGLLSFMIMSVAISVGEDFETLLILRFLQAVGGGVTTVVVPAIVRDYYSRQEAAKVMTTITFIMMGAPLIAPIVGSGILEISGWRSIFIFLAAYALILAVLAGYLLPASRTGASATLSVRGVLTAYRGILLNTQARPLLIIVICCDAIFLSYLTQTAYLLHEYMGVTKVQFPLFFSSFMVCLMCVNRCNAHLLKTHDSLTILRWGVVLLLSAASVLLVVTHITEQASLWVMGFLLLTISSLGFVSSNSQVNFLHYFGESSGTATSVMRASQLFIGASAGALISVFYDGTPIPFATVTFISALIAFLFMRKLSPITHEADIASS